MSNAIQLVLVAHTNSGKTTLARTLLGADIGEVRDAAHVTVLPESHVLLEDGHGDRLLLWDTPGFGDSARLARRLARWSNPLGWLMREVVDRYRDHSFWLSQQALRAARDAADVVLYLVNASEAPEDAGYVESEMRVLEWLGKPVLALLNQVGPPRPAAQEEAELQRWRTWLRRYPVVREVLTLDAFARSWLHEQAFYDRVCELLPPDRQAPARRLFACWGQRNHERFTASMELIAVQLGQAARDRESVEAAAQGVLQAAQHLVGIGKGAAHRRQEQAMRALLARLNRRIADDTLKLLELHRLEPGAAPRIVERVNAQFNARTPVDQTQAALLGAVLSGAATGLGADLAAGGLSFGAGALVGGVLGALSFAGAAWGFNEGTDRKHPVVTLSDEFLRGLFVTSVLRYLAVAHFGRGRGGFVESEAPGFWQQEVEQAVDACDLPALWIELRNGAAPALAPAAVEQVCTGVLARLYPALAAGLARPPAGAGVPS